MHAVAFIYCSFLSKTLVIVEERRGIGREPLHLLCQTLAERQVRLVLLHIVNLCLLPLAQVLADLRGRHQPSHEGPLLREPLAAVVELCYEVSVNKQDDC